MIEKSWGSCDAFRDDLVERVFGELEDEAGGHLHRHLADCAKCRAEEGRLLAMRDEAREPWPSIPERLRARILSALPDPASLPGASTRPARSRWFEALVRPIPAYAAIVAALTAAVLVAAAAGLLSRVESGPIRHPEPAVAATESVERLPFDGSPWVFSAAGSIVTRVSASQRPRGQDSL